MITSWNAAAVPEDRLSEEDRVLSAIRRGEVIDHFETMRKRKDGTLIPISPSLVKSAAGRPSHADRLAAMLAAPPREPDPRP